MLGPAFGRARVARQCSCNVVNALVLRHLKVPPAATRTLRAHHELDAAIAARARELRGGAIQRWREKWPQHKLAAIDKSRDDDADKPDRIKLNIKREVCHDWITRGRGIQPYVNLRTQSEFGWAHMLWQKALAGVLGGEGSSIFGYEVYPGVHIAMASGWSAQRLSDWGSAGGGGYWYYERDGKSWDATMSKKLLMRKVRAMRVFSRRLADHVQKGIVVRGRYRQGEVVIKWVTNEGTVKSGQNDTTSGNSFINALICANAFRDVGARGHILVVGDDLIARVDGKYDGLSEAEAAYGITPAFRWFRDIEHCTFISGCWVRSGNGYLFSPLVGRLLKRLWWTVSPPGRRRLDHYRHGVAVGLLTTYGDHPILRAFLGRYVIPGHTLHGRDIPVSHRPGGPLHHPGGWVDGLCERYGCDPGTLESWCEILRSVSSEGRVYDCPTFDPIFRRDLSDIADRPV